MTDISARTPPQLAVNTEGVAKEAHDKMLDEVVSELEVTLSKQYDQHQVSVVLSTLAGQYQHARITTFLPIVLYKQASALLAAAQPAPAISTGNNTASAGMLNFLRFEFKYILHKDLRVRIEKEIAHHMRLDPYVAGKDNHHYMVRSLYYDDSDFSSYYQKVEGALLRSKFRLRTYTNNPNETCASYLELKGRYNSLVFKRRTYFESAAEFADCPSVTKQLTRRINESPIGQHFLFDLAHKQIRPVILIDYVRRPYISRDNPDFRLTLDEQLYGTITDQLFPGDSGSRLPLLPDHAVMEIKFKNNIPLWFHRVIKDYRLKRVSISKVCKGMEVCNLVPALD